MPPLSPVPGPVRVRFAPSPTGTLHVGSARTALYNYLFAKHMDGSLVLRIEDTDVTRSTGEFEESIMADLAWLGLGWDEGPDVGGDYGPYRQSERSAGGFYRRAAERLLSEYKAYYCFCSQERLETLKKDCLRRGEMPKYDRRCALVPDDEAAKRVAAGEEATIRFRVPEAGQIVVDDIIHGRTTFSAEVIGDFIIIRSDGGVSYNFAVVVDDIAMEISHVIRGEDHLTNTARQVLVFAALGHEPPAFGHHSLIMGADGGKLSKRHGATSVGEFRRMGYLPEAIINYLALLSWFPEGGEEKMTKAEMERQFELFRVAKSPAIFDIQKLNWLNGLHIRELDRDEFHALIEPFMGDAADEISDGRLAVAEAAIHTSLVTLADTERLIKDFFSFEALNKTGEEAAEVGKPEAVRVLDLGLESSSDLRSAGEIIREDLDGVLEDSKGVLKELKARCKQEEIPPKRLFRTLRIALTGRTSGPELYFLLGGLGRETVQERLKVAREFAAT